MTGNNRKDSRTKMLSITARFKSATVEEFVEQQAQNISYGGMFILTPTPFSPGTLLKFELKILNEQSVLAGVGRVVWSRDSSETSDKLPSGMGVKFIKMDETSRNVLKRLVDSNQETSTNFEQGIAEQKASPKPARKRAQTMLGLGNALDLPGITPPPPESSGSFFPPTNPDSEMPPPDERTVMKQATELLKQALAEAGSSDLSSMLSSKRTDSVSTPPAEEKSDLQHQNLLEKPLHQTLSEEQNISTHSEVPKNVLPTTYSPLASQMELNKNDNKWLYILLVLLLMALTFIITLKIAQ